MQELRQKNKRWPSLSPPLGHSDVFFCGESSLALPFSSLCHGSCVFPSYSSFVQIQTAMESKHSEGTSIALYMLSKWKVSQPFTAL
jgi:hypothetical protein